MSNSQTARRIVTVVAASLLLAVLSGSDSPLQAKGRGHGLPGTWFMKAPVGSSHFLAFDKHGTVTGTISSGFGGLPRAGTAKSSDLGIWRKEGHRYEAAVWRFLYDPGTGDATGITRIRFLINLDPSGTTGSGEFFVTQWMCPDGGLDCPDPNVTDPTRPEFAPPGNTFTMTRARLP